MAQGSASVDPLDMWRTWLTDSERQWNAFLNNAMATDEFSQSMGRSMDMFLGMQKSMNDVMGRYFSAINLPTRTDILTLGERLSGIEDRLAAIESALAKAAPAASTPSARPATTAPKPARTKKPAKA